MKNRPKARKEIATFGGGCFWCTEAIFKRLKGVESAVSGYAGGAEAVQMIFDPKIISYQQLLEIFWATHDPTTLNRQGADIGSQYRSVIFYHDENQRKIAEKAKEELKRSRIYQNPIVTQILPLDNFYKAEEYHQSFYEKNQTAPYCQIVINPKLQKLLEKFNTQVKEEYSIREGV